MDLSSYRESVGFIKKAEEYRSTQNKFYSDPNRSGIVMTPRRRVEFTNDMPLTTYAQQTSKVWQENQLTDGRDNSLDTDPWDDIQVSYQTNKFPDPGPYIEHGFRGLGWDFDSPQIQGLGNPLNLYDFNPVCDTAYQRRKNNDGGFEERITLAYDPMLDDAPRENLANSVDYLSRLAHETAHRWSLQHQAPTNPSYNNRNNARRRRLADEDGGVLLGIPWRGYFANEWPAIVNEWTYNQPSYMIHPTMKIDYKGDVVPARAMNATEILSDPYYNDMFPLVRDLSTLKSEPGKIYSYWYGPNEPDEPADTYKRLVYETPSGYWVNPFGRYEETGAQVFDPSEIDFSKNTPMRDLPSYLQRIIKNLSFLRQGQPTEDRQRDSDEARNELRDLMAPLGLRREFFDSNGQTYADMLNKTLDINAFQRGLGVSEEDLKNYWSDERKNPWLGRFVMGVKDYNLADTEKALEEHPMWHPNMLLQPIPIGLAALQKKYSFTPTVDEAPDWRDVRQYRAAIRDAKHCYDLQKEIDTYGPRDGGWGT